MVTHNRFKMCVIKNNFINSEYDNNPSYSFKDNKDISDGRSDNGGGDDEGDIDGGGNQW